MKILLEKPPKHVWEGAHKCFDLSGKRPIFTYGNTIYNPHEGVIDDALVAHEEVHMKQQGSDPDAWWERYFEDPQFRYEQEAEAYKAQYRFARRVTNNRERLAKALHIWASDLSSPMYGSVATYAVARAAICG